MTNDLFPSPCPAAEEQEPAITATLVEEFRRMNFMPSLFTARYFIRGESAVFGLMDAMCQDYEGGLWQFYELSNGSGFMVPDMERVTLRVEGNGFDDDMSGEAAGIVVTLFALNHLIYMAHASRHDECDELVNRYYGLRDFAASHAECDLIFAAID